MPKDRRMYSERSRMKTGIKLNKSKAEEMIIPLVRKSTSVLSVKTHKDQNSALRRKDLKSLTYLTNTYNKDNHKPIALKSCLSSQKQCDKIKMKVKFYLKRGDNKARTKSAHNLNKIKTNKSEFCSTTHQQNLIAPKNKTRFNKRDMAGDNNCIQIKMKSNKLQHYKDKAEPNTEINTSLMKKSFTRKIKTMIIEKSKHLSDTSLRHRRKSIRLRTSSSYSSVTKYNKFIRRLSTSDKKDPSMNNNISMENISKRKTKLNERYQIAPIQHNRRLREKLRTSTQENLLSPKDLLASANFKDDQYRNETFHQLETDKLHNVQNIQQKNSATNNLSAVFYEDICVTGKKLKLWKNQNRYKQRGPLSIQIGRKETSNNKLKFSFGTDKESVQSICELNGIQSKEYSEKYFLTDKLNFWGHKKMKQNFTKMSNEKSKNMQLYQNCHPIVNAECLKPQINHTIKKLSSKKARQNIIEGKMLREPYSNIQSLNINKCDHDNRTEHAKFMITKTIHLNERYKNKNFLVNQESNISKENLRAGSSIKRQLWNDLLESSNRKRSEDNDLFQKLMYQKEPPLVIKDSINQLPSAAKARIDTIQKHTDPMKSQPRNPSKDKLQPHLLLKQKVSDKLLNISNNISPKQALSSLKPGVKSKKKLFSWLIPTECVCSTDDDESDNDSQRSDMSMQKQLSKNSWTRPTTKTNDSKSKFVKQPMSKCHLLGCKCRSCTHEMKTHEKSNDAAELSEVFSKYTSIKDKPRPHLLETRKLFENLSESPESIRITQNDPSRIDKSQSASIRKENENKSDNSKKFNTHESEANTIKLQSTITMKRRLSEELSASLTNNKFQIITKEDHQANATTRSKLPKELSDSNKIRNYNNNQYSTSTPDKQQSSLSMRKKVSKEIPVTSTNQNTSKIVHRNESPINVQQSNLSIKNKSSEKQTNEFKNIEILNKHNRSNFTINEQQSNVSMKRKTSTQYLGSTNKMGNKKNQLNSLVRNKISTESPNTLKMEHAVSSHRSPTTTNEPTLETKMKIPISKLTDSTSTISNQEKYILQEHKIYSNEFPLAAKSIKHRSQTNNISRSSLKKSSSTHIVDYLWSKLLKTLKFTKELSDSLYNVKKQERRGLQKRNIKMYPKNFADSITTSKRSKKSEVILEQKKLITNHENIQKKSTILMESQPNATQRKNLSENLPMKMSKYKNDLTKSPTDKLQIEKNSSHTFEKVTDSLMELRTNHQTLPKSAKQEPQIATIRKQTEELSRTPSRMSKYASVLIRSSTDSLQSDMAVRKNLSEKISELSEKLRKISEENPDSQEIKNNQKSALISDERQTNMVPRKMSEHENELYNKSSIGQLKTNMTVVKIKSDTLSKPTQNIGTTTEKRPNFLKEIRNNQKSATILKESQLNMALRKYLSEELYSPSKRMGKYENGLTKSLKDQQHRNFVVYKKLSETLLESSQKLSENLSDFLKEIRNNQRNNPSLLSNQLTKSMNKLRNKEKNTNRLSIKITPGKKNNSGQVKKQPKWWSKFIGNQNKSNQSSHSSKRNKHKKNDLQKRTKIKGSKRSKISRNNIQKNYRRSPQEYSSKNNNLWSKWIGKRQQSEEHVAHLSNVRKQKKQYLQHDHRKKGRISERKLAKNSNKIQKSYETTLKPNVKRMSPNKLTGSSGKVQKQDKNNFQILNAAKEVEFGIHPSKSGNKKGKGNIQQRRSRTPIMKRLWFKLTGKRNKSNKRSGPTDKIKKQDINAIELSASKIKPVNDGKKTSDSIEKYPESISTKGKLSLTPIQSFESETFDKNKKKIQNTRSGTWTPNFFRISPTKKTEQLQKKQKTAKLTTLENSETKSGSLQSKLRSQSRTWSSPSPLLTSKSLSSSNKDEPDLIIAEIRNLSPKPKQYVLPPGTKLKKIQPLLEAMSPNLVKFEMRGETTKIQLIKDSQKPKFNKKFWIKNKRPCACTFTGDQTVNQLNISSTDQWPLPSCTKPKTVIKSIRKQRSEGNHKQNVRTSRIHKPRSDSQCNYKPDSVCSCIRKQRYHEGEWNQDFGSQGIRLQNREGGRLQSSEYDNNKYEQGEGKHYQCTCNRKQSRKGEPKQRSECKCNGKKEGKGDRKQDSECECSHKKDGKGDREHNFECECKRKKNKSERKQNFECECSRKRDGKGDRKHNFECECSRKLDGKGEQNFECACSRKKDGKSKKKFECECSRKKDGKGKQNFECECSRKKDSKGKQNFECECSRKKDNKDKRNFECECSRKKDSKDKQNFECECSRKKDGKRKQNFVCECSRRKDGKGKHNFECECSRKKDSKGGRKHSFECECSRKKDSKDKKSSECECSRQQNRKNKQLSECECNPKQGHEGKLKKYPIYKCLCHFNCKCLKKKLKCVCKRVVCECPSKVSSVKKKPKNKHKRRTSTPKKKRKPKKSFIKRRKKRGLFLNIQFTTKRVARFSRLLDDEGEKLYIHTLRRQPYLILYKMFPALYPYFINTISFLRQTLRMGLFTLAFVSWFPWIVIILLLKYLIFS